MMGKTLKKWVALFLALALPLTFVGVAEEAWADALDVEAAASAADEAVAEAGSIALAAEDEEGAEEAEPTVGETPVEGLDEETPDSPEDGGSEAPVEAPALAQQSLTLGLGETFQLTLESGEAPEDVGAKFTSSKPRVARVDKKTGKITAKGRGNATITMQLPDGGSSVCKVKVLRAPSKVRLSASSLTLGVGEERVLTARLSSRSASALRWSSSDKSVVTVDREGRVVAVRKGTARIAVKTYNGRKATCKVTVKAAPKSIAFDETVISMWRGDSRKVKLVLSAKSAGAYTLVSDNEEAVVVKGATIQAVGLGSANIIATTYNGLTAVMSVEVCHKPVYRALLVGESSFPGTQFSSLPSKKDVSMMSRMLSSTKGATGTKWQVSTRTNRTALQIQQDILDTFAGAEEGDVSLFYISTHGDEEISIDGNWPEYAVFLVT